MWHDIRRAVRAFTKTPLFTLTAILSLTLGIGANIALFSLVNALLLRPLPVRDPDTLVQVATSEAGLTYPMYEELQRQQPVFSAVIGWHGAIIINVETDRELTRGAAWVVSGNFFTELGVVPHLGRLLVPADVDASTLQPTRVAVLGHGFWQRHYGGDPGVIGRRIRIEGEPFEIVGVTPPGFRALNLIIEPDLSLPLTAVPFVTGDLRTPLRSITSFWVRTTGRLKSDATIDQARSALDSLWPGLKTATVPPN